MSKTRGLYDAEQNGFFLLMDSVLIMADQIVPYFCG